MHLINNSGGSIFNGDFTQPSLQIVLSRMVTWSTVFTGPACYKLYLCRQQQQGMYNTRASPVLQIAYLLTMAQVFIILLLLRPLLPTAFLFITQWHIYDYQCILDHELYICQQQQLGIYYAAFEYPNTRITNCIIWGNGPDSAPAGIYYNAFSPAPPVVTYSIVQGGYSGAGNLNVDPLYRNAASPAGADSLYGTADDGLQLQPCSPAINNGNNTVVGANATTDLIGAPRINYGVVDRGAYEYQGHSLLLTAKVTLLLQPGIITEVTTNCQMIAGCVNGASPVAAM